MNQSMHMKVVNKLEHAHEIVADSFEGLLL